MRRIAGGAQGQMSQAGCGYLSDGKSCHKFLAAVQSEFDERITVAENPLSCGGNSLLGPQVLSGDMGPSTAQAVGFANGLLRSG